jgi:hypothetical protein
MKRSLGTILFYILCFNIYAQQYLFKLKHEPISIENRAFNIIDVIDLRLDTSKIGKVMAADTKGPFCIKTNLENGCAFQYKSYLQDIFPFQEGIDSTYFLINKLYLKTIKSGKREEQSTLYFNYSLVQKLRNKYYIKSEVSDSMIYTDTSTYRLHGKHIRKSIALFLDEYPVSFFSRPIEGLPENLLPILPIDNEVHNHGIYMSFEEFQQNKPSESLDKYKLHTKPTSKIIYFEGIQPKYNEFEKYPWGYCDSTGLYIRAFARRNLYLPLRYDKGIYSFTSNIRDIKSTDASAAAFFGGAIYLKMLKDTEFIDFELDKFTGDMYIKQ